MSRALEAYLDQAFAAFAEVGDGEGMALALRRTGDLRQQGGRALDALELYRSSLDLFRTSAVRAPEDLASTLLGMARALLDLGERGAAAECAERAAMEFAAARLPVGQGLAELTWVCAAVLAPDAEFRRGAALKRAVDLFVEAGHPTAAARALSALAAWHLDRRELAVAALCASQAERYASMLAEVGAQGQARLLMARASESVPVEERAAWASSAARDLDEAGEGEQAARAWATVCELLTAPDARWDAATRAVACAEGGGPLGYAEAVALARRVAAEHPEVVEHGGVLDARTLETHARRALSRLPRDVRDEWRAVLEG